MNQRGRTRNVLGRPWEGTAERKPWDYEITAVIPVLDTPEELELVVALLRLQTIRPFIVIIDTGSGGRRLSRITKLRAEDTEVHCLQFTGIRHPADPPAIAMDLAFSMCRTPLLFATHADCFLRRRDFLEDLAHLARTRGVAGYEITPRVGEDWAGMVSHTATMFDMAVMDRIGAGWSLRRLANLHGLASHAPSVERPNWPDTEVLINLILREHRIQPHLIGTEQNFRRNVDGNIDHVRTLTTSMLYLPAYYRQARQWADAAMAEARQRIAAWSTPHRHPRLDPEGPSDG